MTSEAANLLQGIGAARVLTRSRRDRLVEQGKKEEEARVAKDYDESQGLIIRHLGKLIFAPIADVIYFKAEDKYVTVKTEKHEYITEKSLKKLGEKYSGFFRIHRNALVKENYIVGVDGRDKPAKTLLSNGDKLETSRRNIAAVRRLLKERENI